MQGRYSTLFARRLKGQNEVRDGRPNSASELLSCRIPGFHHSAGNTRFVDDAELIYAVAVSPISRKCCNRCVISHRSSETSCFLALIGATRSIHCLYGGSIPSCDTILFKLASCASILSILLIATIGSISKSSKYS